MPKNGQASLIAEYLETLEDTTLYTKQSRMKSFECLQTIFEGGGDVSPAEVQRILAVFVNCMKDDIQSLPHAISAILSLLTKVKVIPSLPVQDLIPSALALLHMLKTIFMIKGTEKLRELSFEVFLSYPVVVLITMVTYYCSEILEVFEKPKSCKTYGIKLNKEACSFLHKFLSILPAEQKKEFVKEGIAIWLGDLVPTVMSIFANDCVEQKLPYLLCLEEITETLVEIEYFHCPQWQSVILESICNNQSYPLVIKTQLQTGSDTWHRLWIVFVKLLKNQITVVYGTYGTPINSMLPIVETAFKVLSNPVNRCRAFQCWDSLIDNFSKETNENYLPKRIKLLLIPLKPNNAKTEITALAKFNTWWNLIRKFESRLDKFTNEILISFLHFAFGKEASEKKPAIVGAALSYGIIKKQCLQAFAEIVGHPNCGCCTDLSRLNGKIMNNKLLASNWSELMYALKSAIKLTSTIYQKNESIKKNMPVQCVWKAFVIAVAELPPNGVRRDMFNGLIQVLIDLTENCSSLENLPDVIFSLTLSLFENNEKIKNMLLSSKAEPPMHKIISIIVHPALNDVHKRYTTEENVSMLKPLTDLIVESMTENWFLGKLSTSDSSLDLWTALTYSLNESKINMVSKTLTQLLIWPVKVIHQLSENKIAAMAWYTMYNLNVEKICKADLDRSILGCLTIEDNDNSRFFILCITIGLLKNKLISEEDVSTLAEKLYNLTLLSSHYKKYEPAVPMLVDTIVMMLQNVTSSQNNELVQVAINCTKNILRMIVSEIKFRDKEVKDGSPNDTNIFIMLNNLFKAVDNLFKTPLCAHCDVVDELIEQMVSLNRESSLFKLFLTKMQSLLMNCCDDTIKNKISNYLDRLKENKSDTSGDTNKTGKEFTSPNVKKIVKKKREASIVNTVVEDGEEYVVVKSNWKFNPRKLTENQKEKFQRKREIPALYQDLSQSQDEFRLQSWKTDSQDTATSSNSKSSKSTTNDNASVILKNIPSSDVVPNIIENILTETEKNCNMNLISTDVKGSKILQSAPIAPNNTKSPRMALKDRVFRNVRNLIEKSTLQKDSKVKLIDECQTKDVPKTPQPTVPKNNANLTNSAPPQISAERPSRVKRKPKRLNDVELFGLKKRQKSSELISDTNMIDPIDSNEENVDNDKNTHKAHEYIDNNNENNQDVVIQTDVREEQTVQNVVESINTVTQQDAIKEVCTETQPETIKEVLDEPNTENCIIWKNDESKHIQKYDNVSNSPKIDDSQDGQKRNVNSQNDQIEAKEKANDNNVTVELSCDAEKHKNEVTNLKTPVRKSKEIEPTSTAKKSGKKRLRIERELAIDMVEGHPLLKSQSEKRSTRKRLIESETTSKRKTLTDKLKTRPKTAPKSHKSKKNVLETSVTVEETQEMTTSPDKAFTNEEAPCSEDVIESSQDSTFTAISVKSTKRTPKRLPVIAVERITFVSKSKDTITQDLLQESDCGMILENNESVEQERNVDIESEQHKTAEAEKNRPEFTENMDTETQGEGIINDVIYEINDESPIKLCADKIAISLKSTKQTLKCQPMVLVENLYNVSKSKYTTTKDLLQESHCEIILLTNKSVNQESKDDIELPQNKTAEVEKNQSELTENIDTETQEEGITDDVIYEINDESPIKLSTEKIVGPETQEIAEADTQPNNPADFAEFEPTYTSKNLEISNRMDTTESILVSKNVTIGATETDDVIEIESEPNESFAPSIDNDDVSSPFKDDFQRKKDFLNNTLEISPIKVQSPDRENKSPPEETSSDYVVVKLSSPVQSNGEPFSKGSPEFFTEDKVSPDKRDQSPPRVDVNTSSGSPSSSLSLKKNRPQNLRPGGRAAHMLGLCVPVSLNTIKNSERVEPEEPKKGNTSTPARRNLRVLYNAVGGTSDSCENEEHDNFLKFKKTLPSTDSSPSIPILKRKLIDIVDDATASPASKRKRVSFHDPPVSTTVSVQKYIEPGPIRSPSSSHKRLERQVTRSVSNSQTRLDLKLDTVLSKAIESFIEEPEEPATSLTTDTNNSLDVTPAVEIVITSELNDTDPICAELVDCNDPIENIATELSSPAMKDLLIKELEGKVNTVCDLAKLTELEVNRLCIKAPKVETAKKVLADYNIRRVTKQNENLSDTDDTALAQEMTESERKTVSIETQTNNSSVCDKDIQTVRETMMTSTQTKTVCSTHTSTQTEESGSKTTSDIISSCLSERQDFVDSLCEQLEESAIETISKKLPSSTIIDILANKCDHTTSKLILNKILDYVCDRFDQSALLLFGSQLLQKINDKRA